MKLKLLKIPDQRLQQRAKPVENITKEVYELAEFMKSQLPGTAYGLAANQFGVPLRIIVFNVNGFEAMLVNPEIVSFKGRHRVLEACMSLDFKQLYVVERPKILKIKGYDLERQCEKTIKGHDVLASVLSHEIDHLNGRLICEMGVPYMPGS